MSEDPTGLEHLTPVRITSTSATERGGFRKCRRQWFLTTVHRLDPQEGTTYFFLGTVYHAGLEAYYRAQHEGLPVGDREIRALDAYQDRFDVEMDEIKKQLGFLAPIGEPAYREAGELGFEMLQNYMARERNDPLLDEVIAVEFRVNVAIKNVKGRKVGVLSVQADVVGRKNGELLVVDHKTSSRDVASAHLDLDDQLSAEVFSWWLDSGDFPDAAIYNVSMKKRAGPPALLKSGKSLSKAKDQGTTYAMYVDAILEHGFALSDYTEILNLLREREARGEDALFHRERTFRTPQQMAAFKRDLFEEWRDMKAVALHPERAYPNPTRDNCGRCPVRTVCTTIQDDGDVSAVIQAGYVVKDPRR